MAKFGVKKTTFSVSPRLAVVYEPLKTPKSYSISLSLCRESHVTTDLCRLFTRYSDPLHCKEFMSQELNHTDHNRHVSDVTLVTAACVITLTRGDACHSTPSPHKRAHYVVRLLTNCPSSLVNPCVRTKLTRGVRTCYVHAQSKHDDWVRCWNVMDDWLRWLHQPLGRMRPTGEW